MKNILLLAFLLPCLICSAQKQTADSLKYCLVMGQVGAGGYDVVSYFTHVKPLKGHAEITATYDGVVYQFSSTENRIRFMQTPAKFIPQFGGWCSMTLAQGRATTPTFDNFAILSGRLYLFERTLSINGKDLWLKDPKRNEKAAIKNYASYVAKGKIR